MEIYLIRHTKPLIEKGICYGQTDLDLAESFETELELIKPYLPSTITKVYSSTLQRCSILAQALFNQDIITYHNSLMEVNCGDWEMKHWDEIPQHILQPWMDNFVQESFPNGESYIDIYSRTTAMYELIKQKNEVAAIVAHGGVLRSILSYISNTNLQDSFKEYNLHYGCVIKINLKNNSIEYLHNLQQDKEQHKPKNFKL